MLVVSQTLDPKVKCSRSTNHNFCYINFSRRTPQMAYPMLSMIGIRTSNHKSVSPYSGGWVACLGPLDVTLKPLEVGLAPNTQTTGENDGKCIQAFFATTKNCCKWMIHRQSTGYHFWYCKTWSFNFPLLFSLFYYISSHLFMFSWHFLPSSVPWIQQNPTFS